MRTLQKPYKIALEWEKLRAKLLDIGSFELAKLTYSKQNHFIQDENNPIFWDAKFKDAKIANVIHPMEDWRINKIIDLINCKKNLLNLGVGRGKLEESIFGKYPNIDYVGTDITSEALNKLASRYNKQFVKSDLKKLPFKNTQFEQVLLLEVLEHIKPSETLSVLNEIFRITDSNGMFVVSVPINEGLDKMLPNNPNSHMRLYTESILKFELRIVGFKIRKVYKASAFSSNFKFKNMLNNAFSFRESNNLIVVCQK